MNKKDNATYRRLHYLTQPWAIFTVIYLTVVFPFCYFRHDDWLILGNSVIELPRHWAFLWKPTLYYGPVETIWFFRPFFKLIVYLFYQIFGLHYYLWLVALFAFTLGTLYFWARALSEITGRPEPARWFAAIFITCVPMHFGSCVWVGEGSMNLPQAFLLAANTYAFVLYLKTEKLSVGILALGCFVFSLGFKESSVLHPLFLFLITLPYARKTLVKLFPYVVIAGVFLLVRLFLIPINPSYLPHYRIGTVVKPLLIILATFSLPLFALAITQPKTIGPLIKNFRIRGWLPLFFLPCLLPYLGHGFFSPGWLYLPGLYFAICFAVCIPLKAHPELEKFTAAAVIISLIPVLLFLHDLGWWQWHRGQREMEALIKAAPEGKYAEVVIEDCPNEKFPKANLDRVVGFEAGLHYLWLIHHPHPIPIKIVACGSRQISQTSRQELLRLKWEFPDVIQLPAQ